VGLRASSAYRYGRPEIDGVCGGPQVIHGAAASLTEDELSHFAEKYGLRFFGTGQRPSADEGQPHGIDYLVFQIRETNRAQKERLSKFQADVNRLHNDPTVKAIREFERINKLINPPELEAMRHALEIRRRFDDIQKINSPFEDLRKRLDGVSGWKSMLEGLHKPNSFVDKFNSMFNADTAFTSALKQFQGTDSCRASLEHARNTFAHQSAFESFTRTQRAFHDIQRQWELPRHLVESIGALSALQEQVGRLVDTVLWHDASSDIFEDRLGHLIQRDELVARSEHVLKMSWAALIYLSLAMDYEQRYGPSAVGPKLPVAPFDLGSYPDDLKM
jgi:hypothetical protein